MGCLASEKQGCIQSTKCKERSGGPCPQNLQGKEVPEIEISQDGVGGRLNWRQEADRKFPIPWEGEEHLLR